MRGLRAWLSLWVLLSCLFCAARSHAQGASFPSRLRLEAAPLLGPNMPATEGWFSCAVRLHNVSDAPIEGSVELVSELSWTKDRPKNLTRAAFNVPAKSAVLLELPTHGFADAPPSLKVRALDSDGKELASLELAELRGGNPFLFDMTVPSRLLPGLRGMPVTIDALGVHARGGYGAPELAVGGPQVNAATGTPVLPTRSSGYASVSVVVARSQELAVLPAPELTALTGWLLAGGTLAIYVNRPEDLRHQTLRALVGGELRSAQVAAELKAPAEFLVLPDTSKPDPNPSKMPPSSGPTARRKITGPPEDAVADLIGFRGGNLHPSLWGSSASYGLGEVHLLPFDPAREPFVSSDWAKLKLVDLVRHAHERQTTLALPHGQIALDLKSVDQIRRQIDPNEGTRWTIAVSALLLLIYAACAGPLNFYLAARRGKPLSALVHLPIWAAGALALVVVLGVLGKGLQGRARRLSLIETGSGMARGKITRFRGLFASSSSDFSVRASERGSVLDVTGESDDTTRVLSVERDVTRLDRLRSKPWQTVVVREDGFAPLGGGISLVQAGSELTISNRTARDLVGVLVKAPRQNAVYFARIADGQVVRASTGKVLSTSIGRSTSGASATAHSLDSGLFLELLDERAPGLGRAWQAFENFVPDARDWWPDDVPVLIAEIEGGEGRSSDSGLKLDMDRVLVRVLGYGGVP